MNIPKRRRPLTRGKQHYFASEPQAASRPRLVTLILKDLTLTLRTDTGVFSGDRVDPGTYALLSEAPSPPARGELLDLGCGYGPIALALATRAPLARVWAVDVNERALELTRLNAARAELKNVVVCRPEDVPAGLKLDAIYSNPPVRIGKAGLHEMLLKWLERLSDGSAAFLVVQRHLGSDSLARWLGGLGFDVHRLASKSSYRVLEVRGRGEPPAGPYSWNDTG